MKLDKVDLCIATNVFVIILLFLSYFSADFLLPEDADKLIQESQNDLDIMNNLYMAMAWNYNQAHPENPVPYYNYTEDIYGVQTDSLLAHHTFPELIALKNEGTTRFDIYFAAAYNSNDWGKIMLAHDMLMDAGIREKALQKALRNNKKFLLVTGVAPSRESPYPNVIIGAATVAALLLVLIFYRRRKQDGTT